MKKTITLIIIIFTMNNLSLYSQNLANTAWEVYDDYNLFFASFYFGEDTLTFSIDDIDFDTISTFQDDGSNFAIVDLLEANACPVSDTGNYSYVIQNDTLQFTSISDPCNSRELALVTFNWVRLATSVQDQKQLPPIKVFPNPVSDILSIISSQNLQGSSYVIFDQFGRQVLAGKLNENVSAIGVSNLSTGLYFIQIQIGEKFMETIKMIKK